MDRRGFIKIATIGSATIYQTKEAYATEKIMAKVQRDNIMTYAGKNKVPSACWQCVSRCAIVGYLDNNRIVKIEGNPKSLANEGKICAKGQAGINQIYDPDRILYPLKRIGERGSGKWEKYHGMTH